MKKACGLKSKERGAGILCVWVVFTCLQIVKMFQLLWYFEFERGCAWYQGEGSGCTTR